VKNRVRQLREHKGWTQGELGDRVGVTRQTVYFIETGRFDPSLPLAMRMGRLFGLSVEEMFELED
jgi:putative transcriptional regulator